MNGATARAIGQRLLPIARTIVFVGIAIGLVYLIAEGPFWFRRTPGLDAGADQTASLSEEIRGNRTAILTMIGGSLAAFGAFVTYQNLQVTRRGHQTDRFAKALELLADDKPAVRLGGVYALNAIALESPTDAQAVANVLALHGQSVEEGGEADRAAAKDVVAKLAPADQTERAIRGVGRRSTAVGISFSLAVIAIVVTEAGLVQTHVVAQRETGLQPLWAFIPVLLATLGASSFGALLARASRARTLAEVQRPLFESPFAVVVPELEGGGGFDLLRSRDGALISKHATVQEALDAAAQAFGVDDIRVTIVEDADGRTERRLAAGARS